MDSTFQILLSVLGADAATGEFDKINERTGELAGSIARLAGVALTLDSAFQGVSGAFELGASLEHLSARTGQSVQDLVVLQRAFQMVGLSGDEVGMMANRLQRSLGGLNEMGQSTTAAWNTLQIDPSQMAGKSFTDQLELLGQGFQRIEDPAKRAAVAMQLFGRSGGQMLQILQNSGVLTQAGEDAGRLADRMQADAKAFDDVSNRLSVIKLRIQEMFVAAAEQLLPVLEKIGSVLGGINLAPLGAGLGSGAPLAIGTMIAGSVISKLDAGVMEWATKPGNPAGQAFAGSFLAPLMGGISRVFSVGQFAAYGFAIGSAIRAAIDEAADDAEMRANKIKGGAANDTSKAMSGMVNASSRAEFEAGRAQAQKAIADVQKAIADLESKKSAADAQTRAAYDNQSDDVRHHPSLPVTRSSSFTTDDANELAAKKKELQQLQHTASAPGQQGMFDSHELEKEKEQLDAMLPSMKQLTAEVEKARIDHLALNDQLTAYKAQLASLTTQRNASTTGLNDDEVKIRNLNLDKQIYAVNDQIDETKKKIAEADKQREEAAKRITAEDEKQVNLLAEKIKKETDEADSADLRAKKKAQETERMGLETQLLDIQNRASQQQADFTKTDLEKWEQKKKNLEDELVIRKQILAAADKSGDGALIVSAQKGVESTQSQLNQMGGDPNSFTDQWKRAQTTLRQGWETTWQSVGQTFTTIVNGFTQSISTNITGLIMQTESWSQALRNIASTILGDVVSSIVGMGVKWVSTHLMMAIFGDQLMISQIAAAAAISDATAAVWAPAATMATIATMGAAAGAAPGEIMTATIMTEAMAGVGASDGGYFPGDPSKVRGVFHGDEVIFSAPAVKNLGADNLVAMHAAARAGAGWSAATAAASGAGAKGSSSSDRQGRLVAFTDNTSTRDSLMRDLTFENHMVNLMKRRRGEIYNF